MSEYSVKADKKRGKRLEEILKKIMPDISWRARSQLLEIPDSTVIGWRNGREISCQGLARLFEVGCDIVWLLTGENDPERVIKHETVFRWDEASPYESETQKSPPAKAGGGEVHGTLERKYYATLGRLVAAGPLALREHRDSVESLVEMLEQRLRVLEEMPGQLGNVADAD